MDLTLDSKILKPMANLLENKIQSRMTDVLKKNKTGEITLKLELGAIERESKTDTWKEPVINYQLTEKIKETKAVEKGELGYGFKIETDDLLDDILVQEVQLKNNLKGE